jgi:NitT/TauT family transport system substrate-binding protein
LRRLIWICLTIFIFHNHAAAADKIRLSVSSNSVGFLTTALASKRGFFKQEGLDAEVIRMNANVAMSALVSGDVDYSMIFGSVVRAALRGFPVRALAGSINRSTHTLIARAQFRSPNDLRGRTLGVSSFGAAAEVVGRMMVQRLGIDPEKEMRVVALGSDQARFAALKEGVVDAAVISPPSDHEAIRLGYNIIARAYDLFNFPIIGLSATTKKIAEKPDEVKRVIKTIIKANRYIHQNREDSIKVLMEWGRTDREIAAAAYNSSWKVFSLNGDIPADGLQLVIEEAKKAANITREVPISEIADFSLLRQAQKELGIKP